MEVSASKRPTTFLDLPAEIRNRIYELSVIRGAFCIYTYGGRPWSTVLDLYGASHIPLGLLQANRQIHLEAISILYGENIFMFPAEYGGYWMDFLSWLRHIGPENHKLLRKVKVADPGLKPIMGLREGLEVNAIRKLIGELVGKRVSILKTWFQ